MHILYLILLFFHVMTAVIGLGHTFLFPLFIKLPKTHDSKRFMSTELLPKLSYIAKISDYTMLVSGVALFLIGGFDIKTPWIDFSFVLFVFMRLSSGGRLLPKKYRVDWQGLKTSNEADFIRLYEIAKRNLYCELLLSQTITALFFYIMIFKPSFGIHF